MPALFFSPFMCAPSIIVSNHKYSTIEYLVSIYGGVYYLWSNCVKSMTNVGTLY